MGGWTRVRAVTSLHLDYNLFQNVAQKFNTSSATKGDEGSLMMYRPFHTRFLNHHQVSGGDADHPIRATRNRNQASERVNNDFLSAFVTLPDKMNLGVFLPAHPHLRPRLCQTSVTSTRKSPGSKHDPTTKGKRRLSPSWCPMRTNAEASPLPRRPRPRTAKRLTATLK